MKKLMNTIGLFLESLIVCEYNKGTKIVVSTFTNTYECIDTYNVGSIRLFKFARLFQYGYSLDIFDYKLWGMFNKVFFAPLEYGNTRFGLIKMYFRLITTVSYLDVSLFDPNDEYQCTYWRPYMNFN